MAGCLSQRLVLVDDTGLIQRGLHVENRLLRRLEQRVESTEDGHRQDDVPVLAAHVQVAEDLVGDPPDEVGDPVEICVHRIASLSFVLVAVIVRFIVLDIHGHGVDVVAPNSAERLA